VRLTIYPHGSVKAAFCTDLVSRSSPDSHSAQVVHGAYPSPRSCPSEKEAYEFFQNVCLTRLATTKWSAANFAVSSSRYCSVARQSRFQFLFCRIRRSSGCRGRLGPALCLLIGALERLKASDAPRLSAIVCTSFQHERRAVSTVNRGACLIKNPFHGSIACSP